MIEKAVGCPIKYISVGCRQERNTSKDNEKYEKEINKNNHIGGSFGTAVYIGCKVYADVAEEKETPDSTAEVQEPVKINIEKLTVVLDRYLAAADGSVITPKVVSVSGRIDDEEGGVQKDLSLKPDEYDVKYYRVHSFKDALYEEVESISAVGEYKVAVAAKDTQPYEGEAYSPFFGCGKTAAADNYKNKVHIDGRQARPAS